MLKAIFDNFSIPLVKYETQQGEVRLQLELRATPGARRERVVIGKQGELKVYVNAKAVDGEANSAILRFVAKGLGVSASQIVLLRGQRGRQKLLEIRYLFTEHKNMDYYVVRLNEFLSSGKE